MFEVLGIPVYYADAEAKKIMNTDAALKKDLVQLFGDNTYTPEGTLNRSFMAGLVFNNPEKLAQLNAIVHPVVKRKGEEWMAQQTAPFAIHEAALIFEAGVAERLDFVIGVSAPLSLRLKRTMDRDGSPREDILKRMNQQITESVKMKLCDAVIINDEQEALIPQVLLLYKTLTEKAAAGYAGTP